MLGEIGEHDVFVWAQGRDTSLLTLTVYGANGSTMTTSETPTVANGLCVLFHLSGLASGTSFQYEISSTNEATPRHQLRTAPATSARNVRVAFGSCFYFWKDNTLTIFDAIANDAVDYFVMAGDNAYFGYYNGSADYTDENGMLRAQLVHRNNAPLSKLIADCPTLGAWDNHDF